MKREILISSTQRETRVAIIEDDQLVELLVDRPETRRMVGDIYLGRVEAVQPGIQAAFVDIGTEKSAFLHASDVVAGEADDEDEEDEEDDEDEGPRGRGRREKAPPIQDVVKKGDTMIVQITKEPISTKGPRVTAEVSLAGRFLVFMPHASRVGVSRKIGERAERHACVSRSRRCCRRNRAA
jgi:ribonuclease G